MIDVIGPQCTAQVLAPILNDLDDSAKLIWVLRALNELLKVENFHIGSSNWFVENASNYFNLIQLCDCC